MTVQYVKQAGRPPSLRDSLMNIVIDSRQCYRTSVTRLLKIATRDNNGDNDELVYRAVTHIMHLLFDGVNEW